MRIDDIDDVEDFEARAAVHLEGPLHVRDGDGDLEAREVVLRGLDLGRELRGGQDAVQERLGAELDCARDELGLRVGVEGREERVAAALPLVVAVEAELRTRASGSGQHPGARDGRARAVCAATTKCKQRLTQMRAWMPRPIYDRHQECCYAMTQRLTLATHHSCTRPLPHRRWLRSFRGVFPSARADSYSLETLVVTGTVEPDVAAVEVVADVREVLVERTRGLAYIFTTAADRAQVSTEQSTTRASCHTYRR